MKKNIFILKGIKLIFSVMTSCSIVCQFGWMNLCFSHLDHSSCKCFFLPKTNCGVQFGGVLQGKLMFLIHVLMMVNMKEINC